MTGWTDFYLKAPDEASAKAAALASGRDLLDEDGEWITASHRHAVLPDVHVWETPPVVDDAGELVSAGVREAGWFANLRIRTEHVADFAPLIEAAAAHGVEIRRPVTPEVVWAGD